MLQESIKDSLKPDNNGLTVYAGIGNTLRKDDGVGPFIIQLLQKDSVNSNNIKLINLGEQPERLMELVNTPLLKKIIIFDAANLESTPGSIQRLEIDQISTKTFSTHRIPISIILQILKEDTKAEIACIGIQPVTMSLGEGLSIELETTAKNILDFIKQTILMRL